MYLQEEMARMGAEGVSNGLCSPRAAGLKAAPPGLDAVGGGVNIFCSGVGIWCWGEVLAFDPAKEVGLSSPFAFTVTSLIVYVSYDEPHLLAIKISRSSP